MKVEQPSAATTPHLFKGSAARGRGATPAACLVAMAVNEAVVETAVPCPGAGEAVVAVVATVVTMATTAEAARRGRPVVEPVASVACAVITRTTTRGAEVLLARMVHRASTGLVVLAVERTRTPTPMRASRVFQP